MAGTKVKRGDKWQLRYMYNGKLYSKTIPNCSSREADRFLASFCVEVAENHSNSPSMPMLTALERFENEAKLNVRTSSRQSIQTALKVWIKPYFDNFKVGEVSRLDVQHFVYSMQEQGKSPKTIRNYYSVLRKFFCFAVENGLIRNSPCENIKLPQKIKSESEYFTEEEVRTVISALDREDFQFKVAIILLITSGMRKSELFGLDWSDVDFNSGTIHIRKTRQIGRGIGVYEDTTKTANSNRIISLPKETMVLLSELKEQSRGESVMQNAEGKPMYPQVLQRKWTRFLEKNGIRHIGLHGLRHTHASILAYAGVDIVQTSRRLGHSELSTTMNIYTHIFSPDTEIADKVSEVICNRD